MNASNFELPDPDVNLISDTWEFLLSDSALRFLQVVMLGVVQGILSTLGIVVNIFNVVIFVKLGLKTSTNVAIFSMSFTDVIFSLLQLAISNCHIAEEFQPDLEFSLRDFSLFVIGNSQCIVYFVSCWVTAFISIERCVCVLLPFKVKHIFTTKRSVIVMSVIYFVAITTNLHLLYGLRLEKIKGFEILNNTVSTKSRWTNFYTNEVESHIWGFIEYMFSGIVTFLTCQILLLMCSILLIYGLNKSTRIRPKNHSVKTSTPRSTSNLTHSERRLVKVVLMLTVLMVVCNIPRSIAYIVYYDVQELQLGLYQNLNSMMWNFAMFVSTFITVGNFFIYMQLNTKYRVIFNDILARIDTKIML